MNTGRNRHALYGPINNILLFLNAMREAILKVALSWVVFSIWQTEVCRKGGHGKDNINKILFRTGENVSKLWLNL